MGMGRLALNVLVLLSSAAVLGVTSAQAPGDQDNRVCSRQYEYPLNVTVLMDSWKYNRILLPLQKGTNQPAVWDRISLDKTKTHGMWIYRGSGCEGSAVEVCSLTPGYQNNWLFTQYINKNVPANDSYPVRVFVNINYSFQKCPGMEACSPQFELFKFVTNSQQNRTTYTNTSLYSEDGIMPDNTVKNTTLSGTKHFYFDMREGDKGFYLALQDYSEDKGACVSVSRVLVYRHECRARVEGLDRFPAVQAPVSGRVLVESECTENAHHSSTTRLECTSDGQWRNDQILCECDIGYYRKENDCRAYITPMYTSYVATEEELSVDVCYTSTSRARLTVDVHTRDNTAVGHFDYVPVNKTLTFGPSIQHQCVNIRIVNDRLPEKEENFIVEVINLDGVNISYTNVVISSSSPNSSCKNGTVTLSSGMDESSLQLVEMCSEGVWSPVCDHNWTVADGTVVCRELGYHHLGYTEVLDSGAIPHRNIMQMVPECEGIENSLTDCLKVFDDVVACHYVLVNCRNDTSVVVITTSLPSPEQTVSLPSVDASDSVHVGTIAGVAGSVALVAILVLLVLLVIVILWKRRKDKEPRGGYLDNPIYSIAEGLDNQLDGRGNGNPKPDKVVEEVKEMPTSHAFENPIYDCAESSTNSQVANTHQPEYATLEESEPAEYEVPLVLSPTAENNHHPSIYDSATFPDQPTGVDDSVLEHVNHIYSCLEEPGPYVASSGKQNGQRQPAEVEGSQLQGEYFFIEPK